MTPQYRCETTFEKNDYTTKALAKGEYDCCIFANCDLLDASFENSNLEKADLRNFYNYSIDPEKNKLKSAKFLLPDVIGLLDKYDIEID